MFSVLNPFFIFILNVIIKCINSIRAGGSRTMREYILLKLPLNFDIETRFAFVLNIFFISITLSSGMPILIIISSISFFLIFIIEKKAFITFIKKPPMYTGIIISLITKFLPIASLMSVGISIYVLGNSQLFPVNVTNSTFDNIIVNIFFYI